MLDVKREMLDGSRMDKELPTRLTSHVSRLTLLSPRLTSSPQHAFTLIEVLVALAIMALVGTAAFSLLATVTKAWQRGTELSKDLHSGDFVIEQLVGALRAARYRNGYDGLILKKNGSGSSSEDSISWV